MRRMIRFLVVFVWMGLVAPSSAPAAFGDCPAGFVFDPRSGVGCKQADCNNVPNGHWSYEGYCVCGSSGSINENPKDPNKECAYPGDYAACPGCLYACVHFDEECPAIPGSAPVSVAEVTVEETEEASVSLVALSNVETDERTCKQHCERLFGGKPGVELLESSGTYPKCRCAADHRDALNRITKNVVLDGDTKTTRTFDPESGDLIGKETKSLEAERAEIRERLGYKYSEEEIDRLLDPANVDTWFASRMEGIETSTNWLSPYFWWQHTVALFDHGFGNDADFVDTYEYGRCGDSMLWLERELSTELKFTSDDGKKREAMLSITGEKYWNAINHTALIVRPQGIGNDEWDGMVSTLMERSGTDDGLDKSGIEGIDPRLLDAKVLDPYFRKTTTVREFIKGWSVIRIS